jgi:pyridoxamine--pyruvate transaminase
MGLELWAAREEIAGPVVTGVVIPKGLEDKVLRGHMRDRYGIMISGGYGELVGKLVRLGHMGMAAHPAYLAAQLAMLERTLSDLGRRVELGSGVGAALESLAGWSY